MRKIIFLLPLLFLCVLSHAQKKSRVIFFRMDAGLDSKSSSFGEKRLYTDAIVKDGKEIAKIRAVSVFIYDAEEVSGEYYLLPFINQNEFEQERIVLDADTNSVTIIKLKLGSADRIVSYIDVVDLVDFQKYYDKTKWLRKRFADAGYNSVQELINGFTVK